MPRKKKRESEEDLKEDLIRLLKDLRDALKRPRPSSKRGPQSS